MVFDLSMAKRRVADGHHVNDSESCTMSLLQPPCRYTPMRLPVIPFSLMPVKPFDCVVPNFTSKPSPTLQKPSLPSKRVCQFDGCETRARHGSQFCHRHGGKASMLCAHPKCELSRQSPGRFCLQHGGGKRCRSFKCKRKARSGSDLCIRCDGGSPPCLTPVCKNRQRDNTEGLCKSCYKKQFKNEGSKALKDGKICKSTKKRKEKKASGTKKKNWCTVFPALKSAMHRPDSMGKIERSLNHKIFKCVPRSLLLVMACVSKAMYFAVRQLMLHPFKRGDILTLMTSSFKSVNRSLHELYDNMFVRINSVNPNGRMVKVQRMHWMLSKGNDGDVLRPCVPKSRQDRKELEEAEANKRVKRIAASIILSKSKSKISKKRKTSSDNDGGTFSKKRKSLAYGDSTTSELNCKKGAFYIEYIDPKRRYTMSSGDVRVQDVEALFSSK